MRFCLQPGQLVYSRGGVSIALESYPYPGKLFHLENAIYGLSSHIQPWRLVRFFHSSIQVLYVQIYVYICKHRPHLLALHTIIY